jgi:hypothetical protein
MGARELPTTGRASTLGVRWNDLHRLEVTVILTGWNESKPHELPWSNGAVTLGVNHGETAPHSPGGVVGVDHADPLLVVPLPDTPSVILDLRVLRNIRAVDDAALRRRIRVTAHA